MNSAPPSEPGIPYANSSPVRECSSAARHTEWSVVPAHAVTVFPLTATEPPVPAEAAVPAPEKPSAYQQVMRRYDRLDNRHLPGHAEPGHGHTLP